MTRVNAGDKFGEYTALENYPNGRGKQFLLQCSCGTIVLVYAHNLGWSKRCRACRIKASRNTDVRVYTLTTGYVSWQWQKDGRTVHVPEHRIVMERFLGRELLPHESVHHKNGQRDDNRPTNLELWSKSQPSGQRVADKLAWARELLALYEGTRLTETVLSGL